MATTPDALLTKQFLDDEITERTLRDANISGYTGQPLDAGEPGEYPPVYTSLIDLTQGLSLLDAASMLDLKKNSALSIYSVADALLGTNPDTLKVVTSTNAHAVTLVGRTLTLNLNTRSTIQYVKNVTARVGHVAVIGSTVTVVTGVVMEKDYVYIA